MPAFKPRICFISQTIYGLLRPGMATFGGGAVQVFLIAKKLKEWDYPITFLVYDYGQSQCITIDGFKCIKTSKRENPIKYTKPSNLNKLFLLWKALKEADADIYYARGAGSLPGIIAFFCRLKKKKFIFATSSDLDMNLRYIYKHEKLCERCIYFYGLKNADVIIVQTEQQRNELEKNFQLKSIKINKGILLDNHQRIEQSNHYIIWVGCINEIKQPDLLVDLAKRFPVVKFLVFARPGDDNKLNERMFNQINNNSNIEYRGFVPYPDILRYYDNAFFLICTSKYEGFANILFEAWSRSIPVISLNVDPDDCICKYRLGFHSQTFNNMISHIKLLLENKDLRIEMGKNGRRYVEEHHDIGKIIYKYIDLFNDLIK